MIATKTEVGANGSKRDFPLLPVKVMPGVALLGLIVLKQKSIPRNILRS